MIAKYVDFHYQFSNILFTNLYLIPRSMSLDTQKVLFDMVDAYILNVQLRINTKADLEEFLNS